jgi:hypothetical protein
MVFKTTVDFNSAPAGTPEHGSRATLMDRIILQRRIFKSESVTPMASERRVSLDEKSLWGSRVEEMEGVIIMSTCFAD